MSPLSRLGPAFAVEPPALLEYSNSTGATLECRPATQQHLRGQLYATRATNISWRRVRRLPTPDTPTLEEEPVERAGLRVRQDGALLLAPFDGAGSTSGEDQESDKVGRSVVTYRCCLSNRMGSLCSRPAHTRAGE